MYLIDSDIIINFLNGREKERDLLAGIKSQTLSTSIICVGEILEGIYTLRSKKKLKEFEAFLEGFEIYDIDKVVIERFSVLRAKLRKEGSLIDNPDLLIASTCIAHNLILVTGNISHFKRTSTLKLYATQ